MPPQTDPHGHAPTSRPAQHLRQVEDRWPHLGQAADELRAQRGTSLPDWPKWCFLPLASAASILASGTFPDLSGLGPNISIVGGLAAWPATQGIYQIDFDLFEALWETPLPGALSYHDLHYLPDWCIYVACPGPWVFLNLPHISPTLALYGWFAYLEWDANTHREELRLLLDISTDAQPLQLVSYALPLGDWELAEGIRQSLADTREAILRGGADTFLASELAALKAPPCPSWTSCRTSWYP